jgi:hypothetical protein
MDDLESYKTKYRILELVSIELTSYIVEINERGKWFNHDVKFYSIDKAKAYIEGCRYLGTIRTTIIHEE